MSLIKLRQNSYISELAARHLRPVNPAIMLNPSDVPGQNLIIECTEWGGEYANKLIRGVVVTPDATWHSLKPVYVAGRYGFIGDKRTEYSKKCIFLAEVELSQVGTNHLWGLWEIGDSSAISTHITASEIGVYDGLIPPMMPDHSRVPLTLAGRDVKGYYLTNWIWIPNPDDYVAQLAGCGLNTLGIDLFGSTPTPDATAWTRYWFDHETEVIAPLERITTACHKHGVMLRLDIHSGNSGIICEPKFSLGWATGIVKFISDAIGISHLCPQMVNEPFHAKAAQCWQKLREWDRILAENWIGPKCANWPMPNGLGWLHETHPQHASQTGNVDDICLTDSALIDWLTTPQRIEDYARRCKQSQCGFLFYTLNPAAWRTPDITTWQAVNRGMS